MCVSVCAEHAPPAHPQVPPPDGSAIKVDVDPNSDRLQLLQPFQPWNGRDLEDAVVLIKVGGQGHTHSVATAVVSSLFHRSRASAPPTTSGGPCTPHHTTPPPLPHHTPSASPRHTPHPPLQCCWAVAQVSWSLGQHLQQSLHSVSAPPRVVVPRCHDISHMTSCLLL